MSLDKATVSPRLYFNPCPTRFPGKGALSCKPGRHTPCCATRKICPYMLNIKFHQLTHNFSPSDDPNTAPRSHRALSRWTPCSRHRWGTAPHLSPPGFLEGWKKYLSCFPPPCMLHAINYVSHKHHGIQTLESEMIVFIIFLDLLFLFYFTESKQKSMFNSRSIWGHAMKALACCCSQNNTFQGGNKRITQAAWPERLEAPHSL